MNPAQPNHWAIALGGVFLLLATLSVVYLVFVSVPAGRAEATDDWGHRLMAMAEDREAAVGRWVRDMRANGQTLAQYPTAQYVLSGHQGPPYPFDPAVGAPEHLRELFSRFVAAHGLESAALFDGRGSRVAGSGPETSPPDSVPAAMIRDAADGRSRVELLPGDRPTVAIAVPVPSRSGQPLGAVVIRSDAGAFLFDLLENRPVPSRTAETILVTRQGDHVSYISPLRKADGGAGTLRLPVDSARLAGAAATRGVSGRDRFVDYRGAEVLAVLRPVRGTPWALVAKADMAEVLSDFQADLGRVVFAVLGLLVGALGVGFGLWRWQRQRLASAQRALEHQLQQSQKMEAVGRLAGGVAHDFNNVLTSIKGHAALALDELEPDHPLAGDLREIARSAERASSLTRQLLAFSRRQIFQPKRVDVGRIVREMEPMLRRLIHAHIRLDVSVPEDTPLTIHADPTQIEQVLLNLVLNARDAMPDGGHLRIELSRAEWPEVAGGAAGTRAVDLTVADTGVGMDPGTLDHIFEPFFTTKDADKGTGLGLSTVYGIVEQSGGTIGVESEPGKGTRFAVRFPAVSSDPDGETPSPSPGSGDGHRQRATILLVEDETAVRGLARRVLEKRGHRVIAAASGAEALERLATLMEPLDLLLTDMVMAGMDGRELARRVREQRPGCQVLLMSGYTEDSVIRQQQLDGATAFVEKPFTPDDLIRKVDEALARGTAGDDDSA